MANPINIFYEEPEPDRWFRYDRYPRKIIRRILRGRTRVGGVGTIAVNLVAGLKKLNYPYRFNDYRYIKHHTKEVAGIIGKPHVLFERRWLNPIVLGAGIFSHPTDNPNIFTNYPNLKKILVPGPWIREMFKPYYGSDVLSWPAGIDTDLWSPQPKGLTDVDFLIYDKVSIKHRDLKKNVMLYIQSKLIEKKISFKIIRYGHYEPKKLLDETRKAKFAIFLSENETQGLAYQQILATGTPILAWDRGGFWQDPFYYPHKVQYQPVSSVPYWDERCGLKFKDIDEFEPQLEAFLKLNASFKPRDYIMENLTLEKSAQAYINILKTVESELII